MNITAPFLGVATLVIVGVVFNGILKIVPAFVDVEEMIISSQSSADKPISSVARTFDPFDMRIAMDGRMNAAGFLVSRYEYGVRNADILSLKRN